MSERHATASDTSVAEAEHPLDPWLAALKQWVEGMEQARAQAERIELPDDIPYFITRPTS